MKKLYTLTALSVLLAATTPAMAQDSSAQTQSNYKSGANGGYEAKDSTQQTDPNGTTTARTTDKKVDVDSKGNKETSVDIKSTTDPKGLFNKNTTEIKNKAVDKDGKTEYSHKKTVNGKTVEESEQKTDPNNQ